MTSTTFVPGTVVASSWLNDVNLVTYREIARQTYHVNDFGGNLITAINSVPAYSTIMLNAGTYSIVGLYKTTSADGTWVTNTKAGLRLQGSGMPTISTDGKSLVGGTIIQGSFVNTADFFEAYDCGFDVGATVVDTLYAGVWHEGFVPGVNINYPTPTTRIQGIRVNKVSALTKPPTGSSTTWMHTMLFENLEQAWIGHVEAYSGYHCFVSKCYGLQADSITARGGELAEAVLFKSDPANKCERNEVAQIRIEGWTYNAVAQPAGPLRFEALATGGGANTTDTIKIGTCIIRDTPSDSVVQNSLGISQNISIGHLDVNTSAVACAVRLGVSSFDMRRFTIGTFNIITGGRAFDLGPTATDIHIGSGIVTVTGDSNQPLLTVNNASQTHGRIAFIVLVGQTYPVMIQRNGGQVNMDLIEFGGAAGISASRFLSSFPGGFTINATNFSDSGVAAFGTVGTIYQPYKVGFRGGVKCTLSAASPTIATVSPVPLKTMRFAVPIESAGAVTFGAVEVAQTTGVMKYLGTPPLNSIITLSCIEYDALVQ